MQPTPFSPRDRRSPVREAPVWLCAALLLVHGAGQPPCALSASAEDPCLTLVRRAADALLAGGTDRYGPQHSALILSLLDCKTGLPLERLPKAPAGVRGSDRSTLYGSNANIQQDLYRVLQELSRLTGDDRYAQAARASLIDFLRLAQHPDTGLLAWGEHLCFDCLAGQPAAARPEEKLIHEPKRDLLFFDLLHQAEPERTLRFARGLWEHQIADHRTGDFSRHAAFAKHGPGRGYDFPKEGGYFIDIWARAYEKTRDPVFLQAVRVLAQRFLGRMNQIDLLDFDSSGVEDRRDTCIPLWMVSLALECHEAAARVDPETASLLTTLALRQDRGFLSLPHHPDVREEGFVYCAHTSTGQLRPRYGTQGYSRHWGMGYGVNTTAMFALQCYARAQQLGESPSGQAYRRLVLASARLYASEPPAAKAIDIWAGEYGMAIFTGLAAYRLSGDADHLATAQRLASQATTALWSEGAVLPRASTRTSHYEAISYPDTLLLSLLALHEHLAGLPPLVPVSALCR